MTGDKSSPEGAAEDATTGQGVPPAPRDSMGESATDPAGRETPPELDAVAEAQRLRDQLLRTAADYDNFRKRTRRDLAEASSRGRDDLLRDLLPVFDNLERAVAHAETATDVKSLAEGLSLVMRQFAEALGRLGIERIASVGADFDPSVHEAIQQLETEEYPPGVIAAEVQSGYRVGDRLIRPSVVAVAKPPAQAKHEETGETGETGE